MGMPFHMMMGQDPAAKDASLDKAVLRRAWGFTQGYRKLIAIFVAVVIVTSLNGLIPPLLTAVLIDDAIIAKDRSQVNVIGLVLLGSAFFGALLSFVERWCSARVGEGLIFSLRTALFDHVQRMPIAFFTHSQTGALVSRLNNDVIGAQRAVTGTLGQVLANMVILVSTVIAMLFLDWRLTLLSILLLPIFIFPAKRVGKRLQGLAREQMDLNATMNSTMTERFSVAGALLVKLFGRHPEELEEFSGNASRVRDLGVTTAMYGRTFNIALSLVGDVGVAAVLLVGSHLVISGSLQIGTVIALSLLLNRIYLPLTRLTTARIDVMTALVSFERVFDVLDRPHVIDDAPNAQDLTNVEGEISFEDVHFTYPEANYAITTLVEDESGAEMSPVLHGIDL
ncbi:MAG: ABC transporter ATP-binding protein, partial [Acidimicrobiales bacterium]